MRVTLIVPDHDKWPMVQLMRHPKIHGEHLGYHGQSGEVVCGAGKNGAYVRFDGMDKYTYVGCPTKWLKPVDK